MESMHSRKFNTWLFYVLLVIPFLLPGLMSCQKEKEEVPPSIPDARFLAILIRDGYDLNGNGEIDPLEASAVTSLDISYDSIRDLTGIEMFTNLQSLDCSSNQIETMDLGQNTQLVILRCFENQLKSLDVSMLTQLWELNCRNNPLNSLDVSHNPELVFLGCNACKLSELNLSQQDQLKYLFCAYNNLSELEVQGDSLLEFNATENLIAYLSLGTSPHLNNLDISDNPIGELDVSAYPVLERLSCENNDLDTLDLSHNPLLQWLFCGDNPIRYLDLRQNSDISKLGLRRMPELIRVCVWVWPFPPEGLYLDTTYTSGVIFTTECN